MQIHAVEGLLAGLKGIQEMREERPEKRSENKPR
jgi:hypothetical protein